jgi:hypothetical protein
MNALKPFWLYYGGKYRAAPRYPAPQHRTIIEPFAGAAGYSMRYPDRDVILVEKYPVIAGIWRYLIRASADEILRIPEVEHVDALPDWVPQEARWLVGFSMNFATTSPRKRLSSGMKRLAATGRKRNGWTPAQRDMVAAQVDSIRHWRVIEDDWYRAPCIEATWFVDPPYNNKAGSHYVHGPGAIDFDMLARACTSSMQGQVIVCENEGADWLPFRPFATLKAGPRSPGKGSRDVIYTADNPVRATVAA